jgi:similar to stage IV sporulation protein
VVRETVEPPVLLEQEGVSDLIAGAGGLVLQVDAVEGQAKVNVGDMVAPGDMLISGTVTMEGPQYSEVAPRYLYVRSAGEVWARTWRTVSAAIPVYTTVKAYTGVEKNRWSLNVFGRHINFYRNSSISWPFYDKINSVYQGTLYGDVKLPLFLLRQDIRAYEPTGRSVNMEAARQMLEEALLTRVKQSIGADGEIVSTDYTARVEDDHLTVTLLAECREEIGREVPGETEVTTE